MNYSLRFVSKKYSLILADKNYYLWYRNGALYLSHNIDGSDMSLLGGLCKSNVNYSLDSLRYRIICKSKALQRILRFQPRSCIRIENGRYLFSFNRNIYEVNYDGRIKLVHSIRKGMANPLSICTIKDISGFKDCIAYGEYGWNENRDPINIVRCINGVWDAVYTFPKNSICHIHALIPDKREACVYVLTGDKDNESGIWKATNDFRCIVPVLYGKQSYRSCAAFIDEKLMVYATDTPLEDNFLYETDLHSNTEIIMGIPGPVINGETIGGDWWFATTVEQNPNLPKIRHCISNRKAPGNKDRYVHIFCRNSAAEVKDVIQMKKDLLPMWLFQFGNVSFVKNYEDSRVYIVPLAVKKYGQKTLEIVCSEK